MLSRWKAAAKRAPAMPTRIGWLEPMRSVLRLLTAQRFTGRCPEVKRRRGAA
jgi:hypothetical protein